MRSPSGLLPAAAALLGLVASAGCHRPPPPEPESSALAAAGIPPVAAGVPVEPAYTVSAQGGTAATGPGERYNHCERIWCLVHGENFFIDHFLEGHDGWILHEDAHGDVFSPRQRTQGPSLPRAKRSMLRLCGKHVHPFTFGKGGGPVRHTGYNRSLGYGSSHFNTYGTRLEPCCVNGLGYGFVHAAVPRQFRFNELEAYRANPDQGWQKPFQARQAALERR